MHLNSLSLSQRKQQSRKPRFLSLQIFDSSVSALIPLDELIEWLSYVSAGSRNDSETFSSICAENQHYS